jgi:hypothetical protein
MLITMALAVLLSVSVVSGCGTAEIAESEPNGRLASNELPTLPPQGGEELPAATESPTLTADEIDAKVTEFVEYVRAGRFDEAFAMFDQSYAASSGISADTLRSEWNEMAAVSGGFVREGKRGVIDQSGYYLYSVTADYETQGIMSVVVADSKGMIADAQFAAAPLTVQTDAEDLPAGVAEKNLTIRSGGEYPLNAKLTYPANAEWDTPVPLFVLISSINAHEMDYSTAFGPMYKQLAYQLAQAGMCVLRYDNWTFAYPMELYSNADLAATFSVEEEVIADAIAAKETAVADAKIAPDGDPPLDGLTFSKIYAVGHVFSGLLTPRIVEEGGFDGGIILSGSPEPFLDVLYQYYQELSVANAESQPDFPQTVEDEYALAKGAKVIDDTSDADYARAPGIEGLTDEELPYVTYFGFPAYYLKTFDGKGSKEYFSTLRVPFLVLEVGKDDNITPKVGRDAYEKIVEESGAVDRVTIKYYEELNGVFVEAPDTQLSAEELEKIPINPRVAADIAEWAWTVAR